jgi:hypothetical protein
MEGVTVGIVDCGIAWDSPNVPGAMARGRIYKCSPAVQVDSLSPFRSFAGLFRRPGKGQKQL